MKSQKITSLNEALVELKKLEAHSEGLRNSIKDLAIKLGKESEEKQLLLHEVNLLKKKIEKLQKAQKPVARDIRKYL